MCAGASKLKEEVLPSLAAQVVDARNDKVQQLLDSNQLPNLTITLDAWSTCSMASVFACVVIFCDKEVWLLGTVDASLFHHTGEYIRGK